MLENCVDDSKGVVARKSPNDPSVAPVGDQQPVGSDSVGQPCLSAADAAAFARRLTLAFKQHPHINNVMTHIAGSRWDRVEAALTTIFASSAETATMTPLADNLLDLLWAEDGTTGRIVKPFYLAICRASLTPPLAEACERGVAALAARRRDRH